MSIQPLCFVMLPFGKKFIASGRIGAAINFDAVYTDLIAPALAEAGLEPLRAGHKTGGRPIHNATSERVLLCAYALIDLTDASAQALYGLGLRRATRPGSTIVMYAKDHAQQSFEVGPGDAFVYECGPDGTPIHGAATKAALVTHLRSVRQAVEHGTVTPQSVFQLLEGPPPALEHAKTDVFRDQVQYAPDKKHALETARKEGADAVRACEKQFGTLADLEACVVIDLLLSYRAVEAWDDMIALVKKMPTPLARTAMGQEQLGFALNRAGRRQEAEHVLTTLIEQRGPSSETYALLGRVYKDQWEADGAATTLTQAIDAYQKGFEADWRDAYPGINAVTLMELRDPPDPYREQLIPVVTYAVERRIDDGSPDYWDYATRLELAVLAKDHAKAETVLKDALAMIREPWEPQTTARNLRLIREARQKRHEDVAWITLLEAALLNHTC